jgi:hypothetical protein
LVDILTRELRKVAMNTKSLKPTRSLQAAAAVARQRAPTVLNLLGEITAGKREDQRVGQLLAATAVLLFRQSNKTSFFQKKMGLYLLFKRCPKAVFGVLHKCGISVCYEASLDALKETSTRVLDNLQRWKQQGKKLMAVVDNINFTITASEETASNKNKTINATIGFITPLRIPNPVEHTLQNQLPQKNPTHLPPGFYFQTQEEVAVTTEIVTILIARVLVAHSPELAHMKKLVDKPLSHAYSEYTAKATEEQGTEILFLDENKSTDIPAILDYLAV